jgi:tetratricopeptide (TPR) repeat protein/tRNA A-37 threonylcarbamoyl transferase component Bud32
MGDPRHDRVKQLFMGALEQPDPADCEDWLRRQGAGEQTLDRVRALLLQNSETLSAARPVNGLLAELVSEADELVPGDRLGPWRLLERLGQGGMGQVFRAERADGLYQQEVALKLLRGRADAGALHLLAHERQILAGLNHPNIARLLDGGTTPLGRPYLVMELVRGQRVDQWCNERRLDAAARVLLFRQVCEAVGQAHRQLVVHCDIKPANVLVSEEGRAMLLDFGISRLQHDAAQAGSSLGLTPRYASPEQMQGAALTPASDIFSLGRLLQVLLSEPAAQATLRPTRRRELAAVVARASAEHPDERYPDVAALRADLGRWQRLEPLQAMNGGLGYRAARLVVRRWPWVLAAASVAGLSVAFTLQLVHERDRARAAEATAQREAAATRQVSELLVGLFEGADPAQGGRPDLTARDMVDRGRERVGATLAAQPELLARLRAVLGQVYAQMGRPREAQQLFEQALQWLLQQPRPGEQAALSSRLALSLANSGQSSAGEVHARRALQLRQPDRERDPVAWADAADTLGFLLVELTRHAEAQALLEQALAERRRAHGHHHPQVATTLHHLGLLHTAAQRLPEGERAFLEALAIKRRVLPPGHPNLANSQESLAMNLGRQGRRSEAEALLREVVVQRRALLGGDSSLLSNTLNELGNVLQDSGRLAPAVATYREALAITERVEGRRSMSAAVQLNNLASALEEGEDPAAEAALRESLAIRRALQPAGDLSLARAEHNLARWLLREGRAAEAQPLLSSARAARARLAATAREHLDSELLAAELHLVQGRHAEAQALLEGLRWLDGDPARAEASGAAARAQVPALQQARWHRLQGLLALSHKQGARAMKEADRARAAARAGLPPHHPLQRRLALDHVRALLAAGQTDTAGQEWRALQPALAGLPLRGPTRREAALLARQGGWK